MICEFDNCNGYVFQHSEGSSCGTCCRLQDASFVSCNMPDGRGEEVQDRVLVHEISHMVDRYIISRECGEHAQDLFKIVRAKKINYSLCELVALCVSQSVYDKYRLSFTLSQISHILSFPPSEKSFRRKHINLCKELPKYFCTQKIHTPPLAILSLGIPKGKIKKLHSKCKKLMSKGKYCFSYEAALLCLLQRGGFTQDSNLLKFICSFPHSNEVQKCDQILLNE